MATKAPYLPYERLREMADAFLAKHHPSGEMPVPIETIIEFDLKIDIVPMPGLQDQFDVDAFITSDLTEIRVDQFIQEHRSARYRFGLTHETGHFLAHHDIFAQLRFSTIAEWKKAMSSIPEGEYGWIEWQAYSLAGLILVPAKPLADLFEDKIKEAIARGIDLKQTDEELRKYVESNMGKYFEVSGDVIAKRMKYDKLWAN